MQRSNLELIVNHRGGPSDSSGAMPQAAPATHEPSPVSRSRPSRVSVRIAGPSHSFVSLTRNPDLEAPARFEPTVKQPGDLVL